MLVRPAFHVTVLWPLSMAHIVKLRRLTIVGKWSGNDVTPLSPVHNLGSPAEISNIVQLLTSRASLSQVMEMIQITMYNIFLLPARVQILYMESPPKF